MGDTYLQDNTGDVLGPYPYQDVQHWFETAAISAESQVLVESQGEWKAAHLAFAVDPFAVEPEPTYDDTNVEEAADENCYLLAEDGTATGPYSSTIVLDWLQTGQIDWETQVSINDSKYCTCSTCPLFIEFMETETNGAAETNIFLLSETGEGMGPYALSVVLEWYETGQVGGDQLVCDKIDTNEVKWITLDERTGYAPSVVIHEVVHKRTDSSLLEIEQLFQMLAVAEERAIAAEKKAAAAIRSAASSGTRGGAGRGRGRGGRGRGGRGRGGRGRGGRGGPRGSGGPRGRGGPRGNPPKKTNQKTRRRPAGGRGGLLDAIKAGKGLKKGKKRPAKKRPAKKTGGDLMSQISLGFKLKSSKDRKLKDKPVTNKKSGGGGGMGGMMAEMKRKAELRRKRVEEGK